MMVLEFAYDGWLCGVVLFELRTGLSGVSARGGRALALRSERACRVEWLG